VGPGALGGMMAVMLARAGYETCTLARPDRAQRINRLGITLMTGGETFNEKIRASADPAELGPQDLVAVLVKSNDLQEIAPQMAVLCGSKTPIVFLMNGVPWWFFQGFNGPLANAKLPAVDPGGLLERTLPLERVVWGTIECGAHALPDETVLHNAANTLVIGRPDNTLTELEEIAEVFRAAKYQVQVTDRIRDAVWTKLQGNTALNPISALTGAIGYEIMGDPLVADLVINVINETRSIGHKLGFDLGPDYGERLRNMPPGAGKFRTSMLQDIERGRPLELDAIVAAPVEIADKLGVPVPYTKAVLGLIQARLKTMSPG
jgi:2-dehydropantoate 2-reductase